MIVRDFCTTHLNADTAYDTEVRNYWRKRRELLAMAPSLLFGRMGQRVADRNRRGVVPVRLRSGIAAGSKQIGLHKIPTNT